GRKFPSAGRDFASGDRGFASGDRDFASGDRDFPSGDRNFPAAARGGRTSGRKFPAATRNVSPPAGSSPPLPEKIPPPAGSSSPTARIASPTQMSRKTSRWPSACSRLASFATLGARTSPTSSQPTSTFASRTMSAIVELLAVFERVAPDVHHTPERLE